jgi:hypothetical protein
LSGVDGDQLAEELLDAGIDVVADASAPLDLLAGRVLELPVLIARGRPSSGPLQPLSDGPDVKLSATEQDMPEDIQHGACRTTASGNHVRLEMPPQAARTVGPPEGADAPLNQSREAHHAARPLHSPEGAYALRGIGTGIKAWR